MNLRHTLTLAGAGLAALGAFAALPALAQTAPAAPAAPATPAPGGGAATVRPTRGAITAATATSVTITPRNGTPKTFTITPTTTIMVDGKTAAAADLPVGRYAAITSPDGTTATAVTVRPRRNGAGGGAPGGGTTPGGMAPATPAPAPATPGQ